MIDFTRNFPKVTRVEVIDDSGRAYTQYDLKDVMLATQDNGRTLKIFVRSKDKEGKENS